MSECRPSPDSLLRRLKRAEQEEKQGKGPSRSSGSAQRRQDLPHAGRGAVLRKECVDVVPRSSRLTAARDRSPFLEVWK